MTCEGKELDNMDKGELEVAYRFHALRPYLRIGRNLVTNNEETMRRQKKDMDRLGEIQLAYVKRFDPGALIKLMANLAEIKEG